MRVPAFCTHTLDCSILYRTIAAKSGMLLDTISNVDTITNNNIQYCTVLSDTELEKHFIVKQCF